MIATIAAITGASTAFIFLIYLEVLLLNKWKFKERDLTPSLFLCIITFVRVDKNG